MVYNHTVTVVFVRVYVLSACVLYQKSSDKILIEFYGKLFTENGKYHPNNIVFSANIFSLLLMLYVRSSHRFHFTVSSHSLKRAEPVYDNLFIVAIFGLANFNLATLGWILFTGIS